MLPFLQEVVREVSVWPDDVIGWVTLTGIVVTILGTIVAGGWRISLKLQRSLESRLEGQSRELHSGLEHEAAKIYNDLNGLGKRIESCEQKGSQIRGALDKVEYDVQRLTYENRETSKEVVALREAIRETSKNLDTFRQATEREVREIANSVARMEGSVELFVKELISKGR